MKELFRKSFFVTFADADPQGIVYFSRIQDFAHRLLEEFCQTQTIGWAGWFQDPHFAVPLKKADSEFFAPIAAGQTVEGRLQIENVGESSVAFHFEFHCGGKLAATVKTVHVFVKKPEFTKIVIPPQIRRIF